MTHPKDPQPLINGPYAPDDFYRALGYALVAFTEIDGALFALFYALTVGETPDIEEAKRIFYESWNFGTRLKIVAKAASAKMADAALRAEWEEIEETIETLNGQRNQLAHSSAAASFEVDNSFGLALVPVLYLPGDSLSQPAEKLDTRHIVALAVEFEDMADRISAFLEKVAPDRDKGRLRAGTKSPTRRRRRRK